MQATDDRGIARYRGSPSVGQGDMCGECKHEIHLTHPAQKGTFQGSNDEGSVPGQAVSRMLYSPMSYWLWLAAAAVERAGDWRIIRSVHGSYLHTAAAQCCRLHDR